MKRALRVGGVLLAGLVSFVVWGFYVDGTQPGPAFPLELEQLRALAEALPGDKPTEVRVEHVGDFAFPAIAAESGAGWATTTLAVSSYQLVFPTRTALIDTAFDRTQADTGLASFDAEAFERVQRALDSADFVVLTHEHYDHFGGVLTHPRAEALAAKVKVTVEQLADPTKTEPLKVSAALRQALVPVSYAQGLAVAPGVALWKAPGHSPGSQLVYVRLQSGAEYLFLGDVAWQQRNVDDVRGRPRVVSALMLKEDRPAVAAQLVALHAFEAAHPEVHVMPGHDGAALERFVAAHWLTPQFQR